MNCVHFIAINGRMIMRDKFGRIYWKCFRIVLENFFLDGLMKTVYDPRIVGFWAKI
jgi:hypothetical protein